MPELDNLEIIQHVAKCAHQIYLDNWETKTQIAENNGEWNQEIQHRVIMSVEQLSSKLDMLCKGLERIIVMNELKTITP